MSVRAVTRRAGTKCKRRSLDGSERAYNEPVVVNALLGGKGRAALTPTPCSRGASRKQPCPCGVVVKRKGFGFLLLGHLGMGYP